MSLPIFLQREFQIITELTVKTILLMLILYLSICFDTIITILLPQLPNPHIMKSVSSIIQNPTEPSVSTYK